MSAPEWSGTSTINRRAEMGAPARMSKIIDRRLFTLYGGISNPNRRGGGDTTKKVQFIASSIFEKPNQNMKVVHNSSATKEDIQLGKFFANKLAIIKMMTMTTERE